MRKRPRPVTLKACPFCGGKAKYAVVEGGENDGGHFIYCASCEVSTRLWFPIKDPVERIVTEAWNRRSRPRRTR
jgi:Lar family restriction alleviation protein